MHMLCHLLCVSWASVVRLVLMFLYVCSASCDTLVRFLWDCCGSVRCLFCICCACFVGILCFVRVFVYVLDLCCGSTVRLYFHRCAFVVCVLRKCFSTFLRFLCVYCTSIEHKLLEHIYNWLEHLRTWKNWF